MGGKARNYIEETSFPMIFLSPGPLCVVVQIVNLTKALFEGKK